MNFRIHPAALAITMAFCQQTLAETATEMEAVIVHGSKGVSTAMTETVSDPHWQSRASDTATLLNDIPGVAAYTAGGVSSLPTVHGLADDRLRIKVDGMDLISSCPNHMNSPLSYIDPTQLQTLKVFSGITPVSVGGDSIGATIVAESKAPVFAQPGQNLLVQGELGARFRSNGNSTGANATVTVATENFSASYVGSSIQSENYKAADNFKTSTATGRTGHLLPKSEVASTAYVSRNHLVAFALRGEKQLIETKLSWQDIPYELYPNQRMDMLDNQQKRASIRYLREFDGGNFETLAYYEQVKHYMDFGPDKKLNYGTLSSPYVSGTAPQSSYQVIGMPMYTKGITQGINTKAEFELSAVNTARIGLDLQQYRLDDWWPSSPDCGVGNCWGGMAPLTFQNINNGKRDRQGIFGEIESRWSSAWLTSIGVRVENVKSDTDDVHGYFTSTTPLVGNAPRPPKTAYEGSSVGTRTAFNAMNREKNDTNIDWSALSRYTPNELSTYEFGVSRKTRSPNLYERYTWSNNSMAQEMNNFVGDGNAYLGNPELKPEVAHTFSLSGHWHTADRSRELKITPYYTHVRNYIDAVRTAVPTANDFVKLQYANQTAELYGLDVSGKIPLGANALGQFGLKGFVSYTRGKNKETEEGLYNIMPLNAKAILTHKQGGWDNALEVIGVAQKTDVSDVRKEIKTPGYSLVNLRSSYQLSKVRFDFGVENLFDRMYYLPLGGAYVAQGQTMSFTQAMGGPGWGLAVPGMGRSFYAGMNLQF